MAGIGRWGARGAVLGLGALWWWAVLRLAVAPGAGVLEATLAAGGWGLSVLPVHCVPKGRADGAVDTGRWRRVWGAEGRGVVSRRGGLCRGRGGRYPGGGVFLTRASPRRRWGG
ncbi:hypothetical protein ABT373_13660 [Streptomyces sp. NPDC000070]|uniref:hypothetical protein n=1 Tax=Streptomyces sp. NPDC000070 TaxID=3154240 RepID=UPI00331ACA38